MSEWKEITLGSLLSVLTDYHSNGSYKNLKDNVVLLDNESHAIMIRTKNFEQNDFSKDLKYINEHAYNYLAKSKVYVDDIIMNKIANAGSVYRTPTLNKPISLAMNLFLLRVDETKANQIFMYYYLKENETYIKSFAEGSVTKTITKNAVRNLKIKVPSLIEQSRIMILPNNLDQKIALLKEQNQTLEALAQTLFKRWFVDFEFPNENGQPYKSSGGNMIESELGEIPEGWQPSVIGENIETLGGGTPSTSENSFWEGGDILWYSPTDLTRDKTIFSLGSSKKITKLGLKKSSAKLFPPYSLLMTSRATVGEITINVESASTNQGFITLIPNNKLSVYFLYDWLKSNLHKVHNLASGSTFPEISKSDFRNLEILLPCNEIHQKYLNFVTPFFKSIENNIKEIQTLTQLRDTLLPKLMRGELRVEL